MNRFDKSNRGPRAQFRTFRRPDGGIRMTDESTDEDGEIIGRLWTTSTGISRKGKIFILEPDEVEKQIRVQLTVEDDHQASSTITKMLTVKAKKVEEQEVEVRVTEGDSEQE